MANRTPVKTIKSSIWSLSRLFPNNNPPFLVEEGSDCYTFNSSIDSSYDGGRISRSSNCSSKDLISIASSEGETEREKVLYRELCKPNPSREKSLLSRERSKRRSTCLQHEVLSDSKCNDVTSYTKETNNRPNKIIDHTRRKRMHSRRASLPPSNESMTALLDTSHHSLPSTTSSHETSDNPINVCNENNRDISVKDDLEVKRRADRSSSLPPNVQVNANKSIGSMSSSLHSFSCTNDVAATQMDENNSSPENNASQKLDNMEAYEDGTLIRRESRSKEMIKRKGSSARHVKPSRSRSKSKTGDYPINVCDEHDHDISAKDDLEVKRRADRSLSLPPNVQVNANKSIGSMSASLHSFSCTNDISATQMDENSSSPENNASQKLDNMEAYEDGTLIRRESRSKEMIKRKGSSARHIKRSRSRSRSRSKSKSNRQKSSSSAIRKRSNSKDRSRNSNTHTKEERTGKGTYPSSRSCSKSQQHRSNKEEENNSRLTDSASSSRRRLRKRTDSNSHTICEQENKQKQLSILNDKDCHQRDNSRLTDSASSSRRRLRKRTDSSSHAICEPENKQKQLSPLNDKNCHQQENNSRLTDSASSSRRRLRKRTGSNSHAICEQENKQKQLALLNDKDCHQQTLTSDETSNNRVDDKNRKRSSRLGTQKNGSAKNERQLRERREKDQDKDKLLAVRSLHRSSCNQQRNEKDREKDKSLKTYSLHRMDFDSKDDRRKSSSRKSNTWKSEKKHRSNTEGKDLTNDSKNEKRRSSRQKSSRSSQRSEKKYQNDTDKKTQMVSASPTPPKHQGEEIDKVIADKDRGNQTSKANSRSSCSMTKHSTLSVVEEKKTKRLLTKTRKESQFEQFGLLNDEDGGDINSNNDDDPKKERMSAKGERTRSSSSRTYMKQRRSSRKKDNPRSRSKVLMSSSLLHHCNKESGTSRSRSKVLKSSPTPHCGKESNTPRSRPKMLKASSSSHFGKESGTPRSRSKVLKSSPSPHCGKESNIPLSRPKMLKASSTPHFGNESDTPRSRSKVLKSSPTPHCDKESNTPRSRPKMLKASSTPHFGKESDGNSKVPQTIRESSRSSRGDTSKRSSGENADRIKEKEITKERKCTAKTNDQEQPLNTKKSFALLHEEHGLENDVHINLELTTNSGSNRRRKQRSHHRKDSRKGDKEKLKKQPTTQEAIKLSWRKSSSSSMHNNEDDVVDVDDTNNFEFTNRTISCNYRNVCEEEETDTATLTDLKIEEPHQQCSFPYTSDYSNNEESGQIAAGDSARSGFNMCANNEKASTEKVTKQIQELPNDNNLFQCKVENNQEITDYGITNSSKIEVGSEEIAAIQLLKKEHREQELTLLRSNTDDISLHGSIMTKHNASHKSLDHEPKETNVIKSKYQGEHYKQDSLLPKASKSDNNRDEDQRENNQTNKRVKSIKVLPRQSEPIENCEPQPTKNLPEVEEQQQQHIFTPSLQRINGDEDDENQGSVIEAKSSILAREAILARRANIVRRRISLTKSLSDAPPKNQINHKEQESLASCICSNDKNFEEAADNSAEQEAMCSLTSSTSTHSSHEKINRRKSDNKKKAILSHTNLCDDRSTRCGTKKLEHREVLGLRRGIPKIMHKNNQRLLPPYKPERQLSVDSFRSTSNPDDQYSVGPQQEQLKPSLVSCSSITEGDEADQNNADEITNNKLSDGVSQRHSYTPSLTASLSVSSSPSSSTSTLNSALIRSDNNWKRSNIKNTSTCHEGTSDILKKELAMDTKANEKTCDMIYNKEEIEKSSFEKKILSLEDESTATEITDFVDETMDEDDANYASSSTISSLSLSNIVNDSSIDNLFCSYLHVKNTSTDDEAVS